MSHLARQLAATTAAVVVALSASACGGSGTSASRTSSPVTLQLGMTGYAAVAAILKIAHLDDTPYQVRYPVFSGGDQQMQAVSAGAIDLATVSEIPPILAAVGGRKNFTAVAYYRYNTLQQELLVRDGSPLRDVAALKGHRVGYVQNTTSQYYLYRLLRDAGLQWNDIKAAPLSPNDGVTALAAGSVDAFASYGNATITAKQKGARTLADARDLLSGNFLFVANNDSFADAGKRAAMVDLMARIDEGFRIVRTSARQQYAEQVALVTHQPVADALQQFTEQEAQRNTEVRVTDQQAIASQQAVADAFRQLGVLRQKVDVSSFWSTQLNSELTVALDRSRAAVSAPASVPASGAGSGH
jgi:sulfonate transport system substrate-binding protein